MKNTPHINPTADIAETILLPGDPLRAKFISEHFLTEAKQFNNVRGALGYTGLYDGKPLSVLGTGMGMPSMGIYSYELIQFYGVKNLIRIGSCGGIQESVDVRDIIFAMGASTSSSFERQYDLPGHFSCIASYELLSKAKAVADRLNINVHIGNVATNDTFYDDDDTYASRWAKMGILALEMETAALYMTAARFGAQALSILTVSDHVLKEENATAAERETSFTEMMEIALQLG